MKHKKLLIYLLIVVVAVVVVDIILGHTMRSYVKTHEMPGDYRSLDYLLKDFNNDVLILGSSVALNSLDPEILSDSLHIDAYNGASNGQAFTYQLVILKSILNRHKPKTVILGIKPVDLSTDGSGQRINILSPYYGLGYHSIDSVLDSQSRFSKAFLSSSLYRFNTIWFRILLYHFIEPGIKGSKGFIAKEIPSVFPKLERRDLDFDTISSQRRREIGEIINICKKNDINLIVYFPPQYIAYNTDLHDTRLYKDTRKMLETNGMTLYDDTSHPMFLSDSTLFYDDSHLNINGAKKYTDFFINRLK